MSTATVALVVLLSKVPALNRIRAGCTPPVPPLDSDDLTEVAKDIARLEETLKRVFGTDYSLRVAGNGTSLT